MKKLLFGVAFCFLGTLSASVVVTASNDPSNNSLLVYDNAGKQVQSISTTGKGGVPPHIIGGGIAQSNNALAVINYNSQNVSFFKKSGDQLTFIKTVPAASNPVSLAFGNNHLYILGTTTIESHLIDGDGVNDQADGTSKLLVGDGSAAQVGYLGNQLIVSERSNTIELVQLQNGAVTQNIKPVQLPPPPKNDTPVGLATKGEVAYVTIAHSDEVGLVRDGKLTQVVSSESEHAPCWLAVTGNFLYSSNTPSKSISRYNVTDTTIAIGELITARTQGLPTDIDAAPNLVAVIELGEKSTSLAQFQIDSTGSLTLLNRVDTGTNANGVAILK